MFTWSGKIISTKKGYKTMKEKVNRLQQVIELAKRNNPIYINGFMITNFRYGMIKFFEIDFDMVSSLDIIVNGIIEFSIPIERITSIETIGEVLYKE